MPYSAKKELPDYVQKLSEKLQEAWMSAFNAAFKEYKGDESKSFAVANSVVKKMRAEKELDCPIELEVIQGDKFIKELIYEGSYVHPEDKDQRIEVTVEKMNEWVNNFNKKLIDIPFVPLKHTDDPEKNTGDVVRLWIGDSPSHPGKKSLFAELLIKIKEIAEKIGKTIKGCSVGIVGVTSPETGEYIGEALEHVALTNRPYITNLADYQSVGFSKSIMYVFERKNDKGKKEIVMDNIELEKKIAEMQRANEDSVKTLTAKFEAERKKEKEEADKKIAELEKKSFETEVGNEIDKLELSGKITPAEKAGKLEFAKSLNRDQFTKYIADLQKSEPKIKTGSQSSQQTSQSGDEQAPKVSEIAEWGSAALSFRMSKEEFVEKVKDWTERYKKAGAKFDKAGVESVDLKTGNKIVNL